MHSRSWLLAVLMTLSGVVNALPADEPRSACTWASEEGAEPVRGEPRCRLNRGYSLLYKYATDLPKLHYFLWFKHESDALDENAAAVFAYSKQLAGELERMAQQYPALRVDLQPLPEILDKARDGMVKDQSSRFLPLVGDTGRAFERRLLLLLLTALDEETHVAKVLAEEEPNIELKKFAESVHQQLDALYRRTESLLIRQFFVADPAPK